MMPAQLPKASRISSALIASLVILALALISAGCAAPGAPIARQPAVLSGITDLQAQQSGNSVVLTFSLPSETEQGRPYTELPQIDVFREFLSASSAGEAAERTPSPETESIVFTVPPSDVNKYREGDRVRLTVPVSISEIESHKGDSAIFTVRTRLTNHESSNSNRVALNLLPSPAPAQNLRTEVTRSAIRLTWNPGAISSTGEFGPVKISYQIFRRLAHGSSPPSSAAQTNAQFDLLARTAATEYDDSNFKFGRTYAYLVRSVAAYSSGSVESEDSSILTVTPENSFAPSPPQGLVATIVPASGDVAAYIDLSWAISAEKDVAGYNIYRSETSSPPATRLNTKLLLAPSFRDMSALPGHRYCYQVTAVSQNGTESAPSASITVSFRTVNDQEKP